MNLVNNIINNLQNLDKSLDKLLHEKAILKSENEDLKKRMQLVHSEMEGYIKELKEIREHYVSNNNNAQ